VRRWAVGLLALFGVACGGPHAPPPATTSPPSPAATVVNPARIDRARTALPDGYEVTPYRGEPTPLAIWGFRGAVIADPPPCLAAAAPPLAVATARGWSASGPGGIVYAVAAADPGAAPPADCARWSAVAGRTSGLITEVPAPAVDAAATRGMRSDLTTVVEGGTQTRSHAATVVAYLPGHLCFVTVVTDPGAPHPALDAGFAERLLATVVSAVRG
jgi:hypothetical protein